MRLLNDKKKLFQWDLNQKVKVENELVKEVHFSNASTPKALVVEVKEGLAEVPNILLTEPWDIKAYGYCGECTRVSASFEVVARAKPEDYVYEETELKCYAALEARLEEVVSQQAQTLEEIEEALDYVISIEDGLIGGAS